LIEYSEGYKLDSIDESILRELQMDGRIRNSELARLVNLSPPAVHARMRRLEKQGVIRRYVALLDPAKVGYDMLCLISVSMQLQTFELVETFRNTISEMPEVLECHQLTGEFDCILKVAIRNRKDLERFVVDRLTPIPGVARIHTSLVLAEVKSTTALPIP